jgi:hypothetical protein
MLKNGKAPLALAGGAQLPPRTALSEDGYWSCWLVAADEQLLPVLAAHAVAFPVQVERVGWAHADRTLNVLGSVP